MKKDEPLRNFIEPCRYGGCVVVQETPLDRLPWYWKLALVVGTFLCCIKFTVPVLDWLGRHCF